VWSENQKQQRKKKFKFAQLLEVTGQEKKLGAPDTHAWLVRGQSRNVQEKSARAEQRRGDRTEQNKKKFACASLLLTGQQKKLCTQTRNDRTLHAYPENDSPLRVQAIDKKNGAHRSGSKQKGTLRAAGEKIGQGKGASLLHAHQKKISARSSGVEETAQGRCCLQSGSKKKTKHCARRRGM
jgi:hypothetical protein